MDHDEISKRIVGALGRDGAQEFLDALTRPQDERALLIGRLSEFPSYRWLSEILIDLEVDEPARLHLIEALRAASPTVT
jgi:hypothetical protein